MCDVLNFLAIFVNNHLSQQNLLFMLRCSTSLTWHVHIAVSSTVYTAQLSLVMLSWCFTCTGDTVRLYLIIHTCTHATAAHSKLSGEVFVAVIAVKYFLITPNSLGSRVPTQICVAAEFLLSFVK